MIINKPANRPDAEHSALMLAGREHRVLTGLCLWTKGWVYESPVVARVESGDITADKLRARCWVREPYNRAKAIWGFAITFI